MTSAISRRGFLAAATTAAASASTAGPESAAGQSPDRPLCAFSKHFHWTSIADMAAMCVEIGYDGIDLTVREGGHVLPERVEEDLPKAADTIRKAGMRLSMVTAGIVDASSPHAEKIVRTIAALGVRHYRWGGFRYDYERPIPAQVAEYQARARDLSALNQQFGVCAMYHTHSGPRQVGSSFWDLYLILKDLPPSAVSANYDIGHATVEGGYGGWMNSSRLLLPHMRGVAVKDFAWKRNASGRWSPGWCGLGQGMVPVSEFLAILQAGRFAGPIQLHLEYPELGDAATGKTSMSIPRADFLGLQRRDVAVFRKLAAGVGLKS